MSNLNQENSMPKTILSDSEQAAGDHLRVLFTADLHLNHPRGREACYALAEAVERENPDMVVVAGDISVPPLAATHLKALRQALGDLPLAICLGNHDFWIGENKGDLHLLENIVTDYWEKPCREYGVTLLDQENAVLGDIAIVGGYGHYDLGLAWPDLVLDGKTVKEQDYLRGAGWNDFCFGSYVVEDGLMGYKTLIGNEEQIFKRSAYF